MSDVPVNSIDLEPTCRNCRFHVGYECHRYAPRAAYHRDGQAMTADWPTTDWGDSCGEFEMAKRDYEFWATGPGAQ